MHGHYWRCSSESCMTCPYKLWKLSNTQCRAGQPLHYQNRLVFWQFDTTYALTPCRLHRLKHWPTVPYVRIEMMGGISYSSPRTGGRRHAELHNATQLHGRGYPHNNILMCPMAMARHKHRHSCTKSPLYDELFHKAGLLPCPLPPWDHPLLGEQTLQDVPTTLLFN